MSQYLQPETRKNQSPSKIPTEHTLLQYRNGFFQGYIDEYSQRQGRGAYLWNTGEIYYGEWNQDRMEGEGIFYFALGGYVYGTFLDDRVHGYAVLCFSNGDYTAGFWERGVLNGKVVQHSLVENDWSLEEYKDGIPVRVLMKGKGHPPLDTFTMLETYSIKKLLEKDSGLFASEKANNERGDRSRLDFLPIDPDGWYHGNIQSRGPHGLGIVSYSEHKSDRGLFKNGALSGLGRSLFSNGDVYDGFYQEGKFHGIGVYFKSETEQYLYGMYESNECVQALTLGNGFPHELMRTLKADFHLESAEFIDKETETEVLTLSYNDQNPSQEQEEYEDISKPQVQDRSFNSRKRREEEDKNRNMTRENGSVSQVHDSQFSEQSQRSQKIKRETDTRSSISSKKSKNMSKKGTNQELEVGSNISIKDKAGSRKTIQEEEMTNSRTSKNLEKERLRQSVSSQASDNLSERFVSRKSIQAEVNERKPASKSAVEYVHKSIEKNAYEQYSVKNTDPEKMYTDGKSNSSYSGSPQRDNDTSIYKTENSEARDVFENSVPYHVRTSDLVEKASIKAQTYEPRVINRFPTDFSASDKSTSFNVEKSVSQPQSHELKASYQFLTDYGADRSMDLKTDLSNTTIEVPKSSYSLYPSQTNITSEITYGIDSQVRKIMDRIFLQNAQNAAASNLNLPLNSTMDTGITGNGSYMFSALDKPTEYGKLLDRSPTFAHFNNEYHPTFDYTRSDNSLGSYTGNASLGLENKERIGNDNVNPDWNIKVYPSLESSLVNLKPNKECSKTSQITQVTGSFGLIPNAPSEESLTSKMVGDQSKMSQASNTFFEIDLTRDRGVSGKFGGSYEPTNPAIVPEVVKPEYYAAETTYKNYNFAGDNQISTSHGDIDSKSYLKAKTPINKKIEHSRENPYENLSCSPASNTVLESPHLEYGRTYEVHVDRSYDEHVKSTVPANLSNFESPSGRASIVTKTDTWSAYTAPKNLEGGSMIYSEKPFDFTANEVLKRFGIDKSLMELGSKEVSLRDVPSEILDGSVSNRYNYMNNGYLEKKVTEIPSYLMPTDNRPIMISTPEKESSNSRLEEELYKIILLKLELLVKEQNKAVETAEDIKRSLNEKLDALFREERRENDTFKILLNQKLDSLFKERTYDMSREQLNQIHQDLTGSNKQISASFCGVNKKLDLLLLKQGRLTVETEDNLVNKLDTMIGKQSRQSSINANSIAVSHVVKQVSHKDSVGSKAEELVKSQESGENVRSEILIADSSVDYSTQKKHRKESASLRQPTASPNVMIKDFSKDTELSKNTKSDYNTNSRQSSIKEQRSTQEQKIYRSSEKEQVEAKRRAQVEQSRKIENDMSNISDDATEYASIASDSAPLKVVKSMQPKSKEFSIKNEHTLNLLQYESELRHLNSQDKYVTPKKPDINTLNTPKEKNLVPRSLTPTPQSRGHTEVSHRNYDQARSPRPITSQNASMVMDSQPGTYRQSKIEFTSGKSPVANQRDSITQVSFNGRSTEKQDKKKSIYTFPVAQSKDNTQTRDSAQWHVIPLCAQESLFDEPEEIIEEYNGDYQAYEESKIQAQKASVKKNSLVSNHNRANSISSQSSYNVFDLKSFQRPSTTKKGDYQDRSLKNPSAQAVFDNFVVTSNNNDISVGGEYVRVEKNSAAHRNMAFMRKDFESPSGPKIVSSAKKQAVQSSTVDLYEEEREQGKNKKKTGSKDIFPWKNEEGGERFSTGNNEATYVQTSPMRREKGQKTVYQEGRMGTMRWRLEIEDMANETEGSQGYYENEEYERNLMYEKKMKAMSAMNSPIGQRREFEHLMRTVNPAKDIGTYENNMFSTGKSKNDDMMSSGEKGYRQTEVKVPSLQLGGNIPTNRSKKQNPYGYHNLSISHIEKDMKYQ